MPQPHDPIAQLDGRAVLITTSVGVAVSIGRIKVTHYTLGVVSARVDLHFETENLSCVLGVPVEKLQPLIQTWNGEVYTYRLPPGDKLWGSGDQPRAETSERNPAPVIETFPLPRRDIVTPVRRSTRK